MRLAAPSPRTFNGQTALTGLRRSSVVGWLAAALAIAAIGGRRWWQQGGLPSGLDGGQWLALGRGLFGEGRSTEGAYPPLVPLLVHTGQAVADPMTTLRIVAVGSLLAVLIAVYLVARDGLGPWFALAATAIIGPASALTEPAAFGGYPQQVAFAALLLAACALARYFASGRWTPLVGAAVALAGAALAHHVYFPLAVIAAGAVWLVWLTTGPPRRDRARRSLAAGGAVLVGLACFLPTALAFRAAGYDPPLATSGLDPLAAFRYGAREAVWLWCAIVIAGLAALGLTMRCRRSPTWQVAAATAGPAGVAFLATGEVRLLPPLLTGAALGLIFGLRRLGDDRRGTIWAPLPLAAGFGLSLVLWPRADAQATAYYDYYRVVDRPLLAAAGAVAANAGDGLVVVRHDRRAWPIGWWFEGLTQAPIAVGADPRWLGFPDERARADLAARFFDQRLTGTELTALAAETNVDLLVVRKWEWIGWQRWLDEPTPPVSVLYDDNVFLILEVRGRRG